MQPLLHSCFSNCKLGIATCYFQLSSEGSQRLEHSQVLAAGLQQPIISARQMTVRETELNFTWKFCKQVMCLLRLATICNGHIVQATENSSGWICRSQMGISAMSNPPSMFPEVILASGHITNRHML